MFGYEEELQEKIKTLKKSQKQLADSIEKKCFPEKGVFVHLSQLEVKNIIYHLRDMGE